MHQSAKHNSSRCNMFTSRLLGMKWVFKHEELQCSALPVTATFKYAFLPDEFSNVS